METKIFSFILWEIIFNLKIINKYPIKMFRRTISKQIQRSQSTSTKGIWSDFSKRSPSLSIQNERIKQGIFEKIPTSGPATIEEPLVKSGYHSPIAIDETFQEAYKILEQEATNKYSKIEKLQSQLNEIKDPNDKKNKLKVKSLIKQIETLKIETEMKNPEVLYNVEYGSVENIDTTQPIYRKLLKEKWKDYDLMLLMQRLEQLHVIPDTLPTLDPKVDVKVKFSHNVEEEFKNWITPGTVLPAFAVAKPPVIQIQEFDELKSGNGLYTVLLVNPDTPDLPNNSFTTTLHYALTNVSLNNSDNIIDVAKLLNQGDDIILKDYIPLTPEKNLKTQRACLWVFRQDGELSKDLAVERDNFDIRGFVESNKLLPIGAHVWRQQFDRSVNSIREQYGLGKGRVFYKDRSLIPMA